MNIDNDSSTPVTQDTSAPVTLDANQAPAASQSVPAASIQLGDALNLPTSAANDAAPAGESSTQNSPDGEPETPVGADLHSRLEALEKHFAALVVAVKRDVFAIKEGTSTEFAAAGGEVKSVAASFASHVQKLVQAGIHQAEDFFALLFPHHPGATDPSRRDEAPAPVADSVSVVSDPVTATSTAASATPVDPSTPAA